MTSRDDPPNLWEAGLPPWQPVTAGELPRRVDVAVVGGGYTGLCAARALAESGASVVLLERERIGWGASGRNGGFVLPGYKAGIEAMIARFGLDRARRLFQDSLAAIDFVEQLVSAEKISCEFHRPGYITLAAKPGHLAGLAATGRLLEREFGYRTHLLDRSSLQDEIDSARYHGGLLEPLAAALQPAAYLRGLADLAARRGVALVEGASVERITRSSSGFELGTSRGSIISGDILIATNGYTARLVPWVARRVVPVGSFIVATAPLPVALWERLIPRKRLCADTLNLLHYFRLSPDGRLVFGGRAAFLPTAVARSRELLQRDMLEVFPGLAGVEVEYAWGGTLGFTLDQMPHAGRRDGIAYALGYGGHGVALASWLGDQVGRAMGGGHPWPALESIPFPPVPLYDGRPWFLPAAGAYYALKDRLT